MRMKVLLMSLIACFWVCTSVSAQQKMEPGGMSYIINPKPNMILYRDTLYRGRREFEVLFYRTGNRELIRLLDKHQANKVAGQFLGVTGTIATFLGIGMLTDANVNKGMAWAMLGSGFAVTLAGGYLTVLGQRNMLTAITIFNKQQKKTAFGIGVSDKRAGLVLNF